MPEEKNISETEATEPVRKKNWKRIFNKILFWLVLCFCFLLLFLFAFRNQLVSFTIRNVVPKITGTEVILEEFSSTPTGAISIRNFQIGNPPGYSQPHIFKITSIYVKLDLLSILSSMPVIELVEARGLNVNYEINSSGVSNLDILQQNIERFSGAKKEKEAAQEESGRLRKSSPLLRQLSMSEMSLQSGAFSVPLPPISLSNLGGDSSLWESLEKVFNSFADTIRFSSGSLVKGVSAVGNSGKKMFQSGWNAGINLGKDVVSLFKTKNKKEKKQK